MIVNNIQLSVKRNCVADPRLKLKLRRLARVTCKAGRFQRFLSPYSEVLPLFEHCSKRVGVPQRPANKQEKLGSHYYPDALMSDEYAEGEVAWSANYHAAVEVHARLTPEYVQSKPGLGNTDYEAKYGCPVYCIYVRQKVDSEDTFFSNVTAGGFSAYVPAYELCKLEHLKEYGVRIDRL